MRISLTTMRVTTPLRQPDLFVAGNHHNNHEHNAPPPRTQLVIYPFQSTASPQHQHLIQSKILTNSSKDTPGISKLDISNSSEYPPGIPKTGYFQYINQHDWTPQLQSLLRQLNAITFVRFSFKSKKLCACPTVTMNI